MKKVDKIMLTSFAVTTGLGLMGYLIYRRMAKLIGENFGIKTLKIQEASLTRLKMSVYFNFTNQKADCIKYRLLNL